MPGSEKYWKNKKIPYYIECTIEIESIQNKRKAIKSAGVIPRQGSQPFHSLYPASASTGKGQLCFLRRRLQLDWVQLNWYGVSQWKGESSWPGSNLHCVGAAHSLRSSLLTYVCVLLFQALIIILFNMHTNAHGCSHKRKPSVVMNHWSNNSGFTSSHVGHLFRRISKKSLISHWLRKEKRKVKKGKKERKEVGCKLDHWSGYGW